MKTTRKSACRVAPRTRATQPVTKHQDTNKLLAQIKEALRPCRCVPRQSLPKATPFPVMVGLCPDCRGIIWTEGTVTP